MIAACSESTACRRVTTTSWLRNLRAVLGCTRPPNLPRDWATPIRTIRDRPACKRRGPCACAAGRTPSGVDFVAAAARLAVVEVLATNAAGAALGREASLTLTRKDDVYLDSSLRSVIVRENGSFAFEGVPPGDYVLGVAPFHGSKEAAYLVVTVAGADLSLKVQTNTGARVSGRMRVDGRPAAGNELQTMSFHASTPPWQYGVSYARRRRRLERRKADGLN